MMGGEAQVRRRLRPPPSCPAPRPLTPTRLQRVYRHLGDAGMVSALERVAQVEDRAAVAGYMALLFGDFPLAQNLLLTSPSHAVAALEMRKDLLEWETALKLAETLAPTQVRLRSTMGGED